MKRKIYILFMLIIVISLLMWGFYGRRSSIGRIIEKRQHGEEGGYSRVIVDKTSNGEIIMITESSNMVDKIMEYISPFVVKPCKEDIVLGDNTYTMNFYGDSIEEGMTMTINNEDLVEIYTIYKNKTEIKTYKIIGNTLRIDDILQKAKS